MTASPESWSDPKYDLLMMELLIVQMLFILIEQVLKILNVQTKLSLSYFHHYQFLL